MNLIYKTDHLLIRILQSSSADEVLDFYHRNRHIFELYEPMKPPGYYTPDYQQKLLNIEFNTFLKRKYIRFFIMEKNSDHIIGTVSFANILTFPYLSCIIGYKFDMAYQKKGLASEAVRKCIEIIFHELNIHRIEAYIMPENIDSIRFIKKQDFQFEGLCHKILEINGVWEDHFRFSLINPQT
jgi:ribosomal-protein-alanine N-acetyltransferase